MFSRSAAPRTDRHRATSTKVNNSFESIDILHRATFGVLILCTQCATNSIFWHSSFVLNNTNSFTHLKSEALISHDHFTYLRETISIAADSRKTRNHPFGALLAGPNGEVLLRCGNTHAADGGPGHAEANVARQAAINYAPEFLSSCTLYTATEPCAMCTGATYWSGIGKIVFGLAESRLAELTGDNPENLTLDLECRTVLAAGRRPVEVQGQFVELEDKIVAVHRGFW